METVPRWCWCFSQRNGTGALLRGCFTLAIFKARQLGLYKTMGKTASRSMAAFDEASPANV